MNRVRPKPIRDRAQAAVITRTDLDWVAIAGAWSVAYNDSGDVEIAVRRAFEAARTGVTAGYPGADEVIAAVARRHHVTVDALVYGGREFAGLRFEAFFLLGLRKMPDEAIARVFHLKGQAVMRGRQTFKRALEASAELRAQVGWLVNELDRKAVV